MDGPNPQPALGDDTTLSTQSFHLHALSIPPVQKKCSVPSEHHYLRAPVQYPNTGYIRGKTRLKFFLWSTHPTWENLPQGQEQTQLIQSINSTPSHSGLARNFPSKKPLWRALAVSEREEPTGSRITPSLSKGKQPRKPPKPSQGQLHPTAVQAQPRLLCL